MIPGCQAPSPKMNLWRFLLATWRIVWRPLCEIHDTYFYALLLVVWSRLWRVDLLSLSLTVLNVGSWRMPWRGLD